MKTQIVCHRGYEIEVQPDQNGYGAWLAKVGVRRAGDTVKEFRPETVQPEWLTQEEAVRDGIEWGMRYIDQKLAPPWDRARSLV
ncbi:hypothetical protein CIC12_21515 [Burkholderia sp. SG-MS1]|uniref:DUF6566 family protein n=1 Tax=Paraburkholderia sp. SG-MS1 TaxID=2023741 RepID=UPI00144581EC|nr:DUF6566 family protein [Paraburkholderia sp. SG-MS1]NKJ49262.1 hypothetical protein [Paraburkholderia sp. SG-MS1]